MKSIWLLLFLFFSQLVYSQKNFTDSMRTILFKSENDTAKINALNLLCAYYLTNNLDSAKHYGKILLARAEKHTNKRLLARSYAYLGDVAAKTNNYAEQLNYLSKALNLMEGSKDVEGIIKIYNRISGVYLNVNDTENAMLHIQKCINLIKDQNEKIQKGTLFRAYNTLGEVYLKTNDVNKALECFTLADKNAQNEKRDDWFTARLYENLAKTYSSLNDLKNARLYYSKALALNKHLNNISDYATCKQGLADLMLKENESDSALIVIRQAEALAIRLHDGKALLNSYNAYINLYEMQKNYKKKSEYLSLKLSLSDSINAIAFNSKLAEAKIKLKNEEKERENILLQKGNKVLQLEVENARNRILLIIVIALCICVALLFWIRFNKLKGQQKNLQLEHKLLRSQMNPHFIFNALSSIQSFVLSEDPLKAAKYLSMFSKLIRAIFDNSRRETITINEEIETLKLYMELECVRSKDPINFQIKVDDQITNEIMVPPMLVQPYIENAIKHGLKNMILKGSEEIIVSFYFINKSLYCSVEDNGIGINAAKLLASKNSLHKSSGIIVTSQRLELLSKFFGFKFDFFIIDKSELNNNLSGTIVKFLLPYKYETKGINS